MSFLPKRRILNITLIQHSFCYSTMSPKPTSKRTNSRSFLDRYHPAPSIPLPKHKPSSVSRRERHLTRLMHKIQCASNPQLPTVDTLVLPYWLKGNTSHKNTLRWSGLDRNIQVASPPRLTLALKASVDPNLRQRFEHRGWIKKSDLEQVASLDTSKCKLDELMENENPNEFHLVPRSDVEAILGTESNDIARAVMNNQMEVEVDSGRDAVHRIVSQCANLKARRKRLVQKVMAHFAPSPADHGSASVQGNYFDLRIYPVHVSCCHERQYSALGSTCY